MDERKSQSIRDIKEGENKFSKVAKNPEKWKDDLGSEITDVAHEVLEADRKIGKKYTATLGEIMRREFYFDFKSEVDRERARDLRILEVCEGFLDNEEFWQKVAVATSQEVADEIKAKLQEALDKCIK